MGYINEGPDPRARGWLGAVFGFIQTKLSFHSSCQPAHVMVCFPPYVSIAIPWFWLLWSGKPMKYTTLRIGWRRDGNWNGFVADVVLKLREEQVHY